MVGLMLVEEWEMREEEKRVGKEVFGRLRVEVAKNSRCTKRRRRREVQEKRGGSLGVEVASSSGMDRRPLRL